MDEYTTHHGCLELLPEHASRGLHFLKDFLPAYDAIGSLNTPPPLGKFLFHDTTFNHGEGSVIRSAVELNLIRFRSQYVSSRSRKIRVAKDDEGPEGTRRVSIESTLTIVYKNHLPGASIVIKELVLLLLSPTDDPSQGSHGLKFSRLAEQIRAEKMCFQGSYIN
ncbi:hypothetical protein PT974_03892 [Cladobotryum mycophilum]|uniref:Uncharacterized protein n=1 Tax=Cladobotryum mycophilum TaxID=491253 RepID=A0ABR0STK8_9HYPO